MSRIARAVLDGIPHHITHRGNGRQVVFDTSEGRRLYLALLRRNCERFQLSISAYCLMTNHVHLVATPHRNDSLARALGRTHAEYARYLNLCRLSCGHVWQARFFSYPLSHTHFWNAMAYVERNPVRSGLTRTAAEYEWSSARAHIQGHDLGGFLDLEAWQHRFNGRSWEELLNFTDDAAWTENLREATQRGRPYADAETTAAFEQRLGRILRPRPAGRSKWQQPEAGR